MNYEIIMYHNTLIICYAVTRLQLPQAPRQTPTPTQPQALRQTPTPTTQAVTVFTLKLKR